MIRKLIFAVIGFTLIYFGFLYYRDYLHGYIPPILNDIPNIIPESLLPGQNEPQNQDGGLLVRSRKDSEDKPVLSNKIRTSTAPVPGNVSTRPDHRPVFSGYPSMVHPDTDLLEMKDCAFSTLRGDTLLPFLDVNDVVKIQKTPFAVKFYSRNGIRIFYLKSETWSIGTREAEGPRVYYNDTLSADTQKIAEDEGYVLVRDGKNGQWMYEGVISPSGEKVFIIPYRQSRAIAVQKPYIWLGGDRGVTRIHMQTGRRDEYNIVPNYTEIAGFTDHQGIRYIVTTQGGVYAFHKESGAVQQLPLPNRRFLNCFSNPVVFNNKLYIGANDVILMYDLNRKGWNMLKLPSAMGIRKLVLANGIIWCFGNFTAGEEFSRTVNGGLAAITSGNKIVTFPLLDGTPLGGYIIDREKIMVLTDKSKEILSGTRKNTKNTSEPKELAQANFICRIPFNKMQIDFYQIVTKTSPEIKKYTPLTFTLDRSQMADVYTWRVQMKVEKTEGERVEILGR